jgi:hypothetical protein
LFPGRAFAAVLRSTIHFEKEDSMTMPRLRGYITTWFVKRAFGFITVYDEVNRPVQKYYVHISKLRGTPALNAVVEFDVNPVLEGQLPSVIDAEIVVTP